MNRQFITNGRPHEPITRKLMEAFGQERGLRVSHQEIEVIVGETRSTGRYRGYVASWRRRLLNECGIHLINVPSWGYEFATAPNQVLSGSRIFEQAKKRVAKSAKVLAATPDTELDEQQRRAKLHTLGVAAGTLSQMKERTRDTARLLAALHAKKD